MTVVSGRIAIGSALLAALAFGVGPAIGSVATAIGADTGNASKVSLSALGSIGSFTPVTNDPRLASAYVDARRGATKRSFRFTPATGSFGGRRSITIAVRAPSLDEGAQTQRSAASTSLGLGSVSYNLRSVRGLGRFAAEAAGSADADPILRAPIEMPRGFTIEAPRRLSTDIDMEAMAPGNAAARTLVGTRGYAVDVNSSFSLTRNLDVTAGVRYNGRQQRLTPLTDAAQDSQAVYVGTTFKF